jgi:hypothetical protein
MNYDLERGLSSPQHAPASIKATAFAEAFTLRKVDKAEVLVVAVFRRSVFDNLAPL